MAQEYEKVLFRDRGRDPETAHCVPLGRGRYRLANILFLHASPTLDDVVEATEVEGVLTCRRIAKRGGRTTMILDYPSRAAGKKLAAFLRASFDAESEGPFEGRLHVAIDRKHDLREVFAAAGEAVPGIAAVHPFRAGKVAPSKKRTGKSAEHAPTLFEAVRDGKTALVEAFVAEGAELNPKKEHPLLAAAMRNRAKEAKLLIAAGSDPRRAFDRDGDPVLVTAAFRESAPVLRAFLAVPHTTAAKSLALLEAAGVGNLGIVKLLVKHGADPHWTSKKGNSALSIAKKKRLREIVAYFDALDG